MESVHTYYRHPGEAVQNLSMFARAWDECVELQSNPREVWIGHSLVNLQNLARWEIGVFDDDKIMGGILLAEMPWDAHVGPCLAVFAQYVLPEYRLRGVSPRLMRESIRIARKAGAPTLSFTHRKGPWRYDTLYRRLNAVST